MAMGKRKYRQGSIWVSTAELPQSPGHPFYERLNGILDEAGFDVFVEKRCERFYAGNVGRPSLQPGRYFRLFMLGYLEGLDSERGIAWRASDSLGVRGFLGLGLEERAPDHSTISRTRRLIDQETHEEVFRWVLERLAGCAALALYALIVRPLRKHACGRERFGAFCCGKPANPAPARRNLA
jgi:transposase